MSDIVERLRAGEPCLAHNDLCRMMEARSGCTCAEAADEIERLRAEAERIKPFFEEAKAKAVANAVRCEKAEAEIERLRAALEQIRNQDQLSYIQIGDDPNENGPTIQIDGPFAKIARAALKEPA